MRLILTKITSCSSNYFRKFSTNSVDLNQIGSKINENIHGDPVSNPRKLLRIAILGLPNVGKSTLVNQLVERPLCAASSKVHTTQTKAAAIYTHKETQLIFLDTPGLVKRSDVKKYNLNESFTIDPWRAVQTADIVAVLQDVSYYKAKESISPRILSVLKELKLGTPTILILNKVDLIKHKKLLLDIVKKLTGPENWPHFSDVFMISALSGDGVDDVRNYFLDTAKPQDWEYDREVFTDQEPENIVQQAIRAKFLDTLAREVPYALKFGIEYFETSADGTIHIVGNIDAPTDRIHGLALGKHGATVKDIALKIEKELSSAYRTSVRLKLAVNLKKPIKK